MLESVIDRYKKGNKKDVFFPDGLQDNIKKIDSWDWNIHKGQRLIICCIQDNVSTVAEITLFAARNCCIKQAWQPLKSKSNCRRKNSQIRYS